MKRRVWLSAVGFAALCLCFPTGAAAQAGERVGGTWQGPDSALLRGILSASAAPAVAPSRARPDVLKFKPAGESGVPKTLGDALGRTAEERALLSKVFAQVRQAYEAEVAQEGKSNDLAAAMTFFISTNVAAFHRTELPSDAATDELYRSLQGAMAGSPAFARMADAEKQRMHDWLVCMAGFVLAGYADARQGGDQANLQNFGELADYSMRLVLGVEAGKVSLNGSRLSVASDAAAGAAPAAGGSVVGVWDISASSPAGGNAGYYKGQYRFKPDGTYTFKSERWLGYARSKEFYTIEESGTYAVAGDSLTVSPTASKTTLRNPEGVVQRVQNNQLERVTYRWRLHYFEGINETQLILQPPRETARDGGFSSSSLFPNSYLYGPGGKLEWRF